MSLTLLFYLAGVGSDCLPASCLKCDSANGKTKIKC